ncbi:MAG: hypothetical protein GX657_06030 [Chloroflexi bacterium]|nr:hypothetical protein [Chloroflexota bacterium]
MRRLATHAASILGRALLATVLVVGLAGCAPLLAELASESLTAPAGVTPPPTRVPAAPRPREGGALSAAEVFARVAPGIAFIDTPTGTGSGILLESGHVLTNAHVVWPFDEARVVLPDGSAWDAAPVAAWDLFVDLALLGPLEAAAPALALSPGEDLGVASTVYLVGYPGEVEAFPQPAISGGLISRYRQWQGMGITYLQVAATITGGQSGGALVSENGDVIGVSGFLFANTYGLIASSEDLAPHVTRLVDESRANLGRTGWFPRGAGSRRHNLTLDNLWDTRMFLIQEPPGSTIRFEVESDNDVYVEVLDAYGDSLTLVDDTYSGYEEGELTLETPGPHFLVIAQSDEARGRFRLQTNHPVLPYQDAEDGRVLAVGETISGTIDYPMDFDYYLLDLQEGQTVEIVVDSVMIDPYLRVDFWGASGEEYASDDDSGGGLFGENSRLIYTAPRDDTYFVLVEDALQEYGGYLLTVAEPTP